MGATLTLDDFKRIGKSRRAVLLGWAAQFSIMPSMALLMSRYVAQRLFFTRIPCTSQ